MSRTTYYTATTLDGFIADTENSLSWLFEVPGEGEATNRFGSFFAGVGAFVMGATTYEWVLEHEDVLNSPEKWTSWYGETPGWVMTHRDLPQVPGVRFAQGDVRDVHREMLEAAGDKDVWVAGGGELVGQLHDAGLLDELRVSVAPATLGAGAPLLPRRIRPKQLTLTDVEREGQFVHLTYAVRR
jgi:dihydrofolate reductase